MDDRDSCRRHLRSRWDEPVGGQACFPIGVSDRPRPDQFSCRSTVIETLRSAVTPGPRKFPMNARKVRLLPGVGARHVHWPPAPYSLLARRSAKKRAAYGRFRPRHRDNHDSHYKQIGPWRALKGCRSAAPEAAFCDLPVAIRESPPRANASFVVAANSARRSAAVDHDLAAAISVNHL